MTMNEISAEDQIAITKAIMKMLDDWGVPSAGIINVLGLPEGTRTRHIEKFRLENPLPSDDSTMERVRHLAGIADALRTMYPHNPQQGVAWMNKPHRRFSGRSPVATMSEEGLSGLIKVRCEVDCTFDWARADSNF